MYNRGPKAFLIGTGGVALNRLVKLDSGTVVFNTATATDEPIGGVLNIDFDEAYASVQFFKDDGTMQLEAAGAVTQDADVYAAAAGKIQALPSVAGDYLKVGKALQAGTGDGSVIEVLPLAVPEVVTVAADSPYSAGATVAANRLVKFDASMDLVHNTATSTDDPVAVAQNAGDAADPLTLTWLSDGSGPVGIELSGAASAGDELYAAAAGKAQALPAVNGTYRHIGVAMGDGEDAVIDVLPYDIHATETVSL
ncbi:MAG: hypothetical protein K9L23_22445 [Desulfotignum sp.]|nr:hypothetical protein [Desulfotignum sp.]